jgi:hypothetical protein
MFGLFSSSFLTPEECNVYSSTRLSNSAVRKSGIRSKLRGIAMPLFRTEPEEDGFLAIYIALLRSEEPDIVLFAFLIFAIRSKVLEYCG